VPTSDSTADLMTGMFNLMSRGLFWSRLLFPTDERSGGSPPFAETRRPGPETSGAPSLEEASARRFLGVLERMNGISMANSRIAHAYARLWLTSIFRAVGDAGAGDDTLARRKQAVGDLLKGYETLSREYIEMNLHLLAAIARMGR
jgi:hypothetical protein